MFLFPISAFITWKWLLWKILIKHRLFPGWTETECYSYSIAWHFALCAGSYDERVPVCMCVHMCVCMCVACGRERAVAAAVSVSFSSIPSSNFSGVGCMADPFVWSRFSSVSSPWSWAGGGCACRASQCGQEEGEGHACV